MERSTAHAFPDQTTIKAYLTSIHPGTKNWMGDRRMYEIAAKNFADTHVEVDQIPKKVERILLPHEICRKDIERISQALIDLSDGFDPNDRKLYFPNKDTTLDFLKKNLPGELFKSELIGALAENFADTAMEREEIPKLITITLHKKGYPMNMTAAAMCVFLERALEDLLIAECKKFLKSRG